MKFVVFFRALNVGKNNRIKSAQLKSIFTDCGAYEIETILQSGNVIFCVDGIDDFFVRLKNALLSVLNTKPNCIIFTQAEFLNWWNEIETAIPENVNGSWVQVLISKNPQPIVFVNNEFDQELLRQPTWVVYHPKGVSKSKLKVEGVFKLEPESTFRNLNTLNKVKNKLSDI